MLLSDTHSRENVDGSKMEVSISTTAHTYAHEFAHCVGVPDEYSYSQNIETLQYVKPNGSLNVLAYAGIAALIGFAGSSAVLKRDNKMPTAPIDIGRPIEEIARNSGISKFSIMKVAGLIDYSVSNFPRDIPVRFARQNLEVIVSPIHYVSITTDKDRSPGNIASAATLLFDTTSLTTHQQALDFIYTIIHQFNSKEWKRYIAEDCPAVSGRSSILNIDGAIDSGYCGIDPLYRVSLDEWRELAPNPQYYAWVAEGIVAKLKVSGRRNQHGLFYSIELEFEDHNIQLAVDADNTARDRAQGDAKGWNTTANDLKAEEEQRQLVKQLEKKAVERGDKVVSRYNDQ